MRKPLRIRNIIIVALLAVDAVILGTLAAAPAAGWAAAVLLLAATAATAVLKIRRWHVRTARPALIVAAADDERLAGIDPDDIRLQKNARGTLLTPGKAARVRLDTHRAGVMNPKTVEKLTTAVSRGTGTAMTIDESASKPGKRLIFTPKPAATAEKDHEPKDTASRLEKAATDLLSDGATVTTTDDESGELAGAQITGFNSMALAMPNKRKTTLLQLRSRLPHNGADFEASIDTDNDAINFTKRRPLPTWVASPAEHPQPVATRADYKNLAIPYAVGDNGQIASWRPGIADPHMLVAGETGGGKTITLNTLIQALTQAGVRVWLLDGKGIEFMGYENWPNVEVIAQTTEEHARALLALNEISRARYELIRERKAKETDFAPIVMIADEITQILSDVDKLYAAHRSREDEKKLLPAKSGIMESLKSFVRLARSSSCHGVFGIQQPNANDLSGTEFRQNVTARVSLGSLEAASADMVWGAQIGRFVPQIKGRGWTKFNGVPAPAQMIFTPSPEPGSNSYVPGMVAQAWPHPERVVTSRKYIKKLDGSAPDTTWADIISAPFLTEDGQRYEFDPLEATFTGRQSAAAPAKTGDRQPITLADGQQVADLYPPADSVTIGRDAAEALARIITTSIDAPASATAEPVAPAVPAAVVVDDSTAAQIHPGELSQGDVVLTEAGQVVVERIDPAGESIHVTGYTPGGNHTSIELIADEPVPAVQSDREKEFA
ncbi:helicase HerA-like domain-containing protein [Arthrobacter castelli]|uniref:helicase HerA-like domain-containing protein n=1 Tax=Arthrobacter castelli TaxID=271431 RepID=UPI000402DC47|nr:helicase HerA-like domain-containing protein [Arthrobacter castelli]